MSDTQTLDPIAAALARAKEAAGAHVANQQLATTTAPAAGAVTVARAAPLSMEDMGSGGISVESWMGVKEFGLLFGPNKALVSEPVRVLIDMNAVQPCYAVKYGNPATYSKTYDHVTDVRGGSWLAALQKAQAINPDAREYRSADVPFTLMADVTVKQGKDSVVVAKKGEVVGYSIPTTGWGNWEAFYKSAVQRGLAKNIIVVELTAEKRTNKANNVWGLVVWTLLEAETASMIELQAAA